MHRRRSAAADSRSRRPPAGFRSSPASAAGSNAIGIFHAFLPDAAVKLIGIEAGGRSEKSATMPRASAAALRRAAGVAQLPAAGRSRAGLADAFRFRRARLPDDRPRARVAARSERAEYVAASTGKRSPAAMQALAHRRHHSRARIGARPRRAFRRAPGAKGQVFIVNVSGRGDKDIDIYRENFPELDLA